MLFIPITVAAAVFQVARNATQRSLMPGAGPWGATLVRFLFGLPFSIAFLAVAFAVFPQSRLTGSAFFWTMGAAGGLCQIGATAALLVSMQRSSFALGTAFQQSQLLFTAAIGAAFFQDLLSLAAWLGVGLVTAGLLVLSWPKTGWRGDWSGAWLGLLSGVLFGLSSNAFRQAALSLGTEAPAVVAGISTLVAVQAMQSAALGGWLALRDRPSLMSAVTSWKPSMRAGFFGAAASSLWFTGFVMAPASVVKAVGVVEMPIAALAGRRLFAEKLTLLQWIVGTVTAAGVVLAAVG